MPALTLALTVLHAGGKFGGGGYKVSGGLHGVGVSVVNALSSRLIAEVRNRGHLWRQSFAIGVPEGPLEDVRELEPDERPAPRSPTTPPRTSSRPRRTPWRPSPRGSASTPSSTRVWRSSYATSARSPRTSPTPSRRTSRGEETQERPDDLKRAEGGGIEQVFRYDRGLVDFVEHLNRRKTIANPTIINFEAETPESHETHMSLELAMQWNTTYNESVHTFANTINTHEGGTHEEGFRASLTTLVNNWGEEWGLIKKSEDRVKGDDIREGLTAIISIKLADPQFEGQTKTKLGNTEAKGFVQRIVNDQLGDWFQKNPAEGRDIVRKAQAAAQARVAARKARDLARSRKDLFGGGGLPASSRTASRPTPRSARSSSSRATRPVARHVRAGTPGSRRSCRSAARSSTSRRPGSTRCWPTPRCSRSSPRSAPACTRSSTSTSCATTRWC